MKHYIIKIAVFAIAFILFITFLLVIPYSPKTNKQMFIEKSKDSLLINIESPRIIFIGGSNITFGLNSQLVNDSLKLNPINTGIHAEIGLKYMLKSPVEYIREGDIIIVIPEYEHYYEDLADGRAVLLSLLFEVSHKFNMIDYNQYINLSSHIPKYLTSKLKFWNDFKSDKVVENDITGLASYNIYGDAYKHWSLPKPGKFTEYDIGEKINMETYSALSEFKTSVESKKAHVYISFPCLAESAYNKGLTSINFVENKLTEMQFNILGKPSRYMVNDSLIFNTQYHLTKEGADLRTKLLIEDFKKFHTQKKDRISYNY